jgi:glycine oxidase
LIGPGAIDGLILATGHHRNGFLLTPPTAETVAALLCGEAAPPEARAAHPGRFASESAPGLSAAPAGEEIR